MTCVQVCGRWAGTIINGVTFPPRGPGLDDELDGRAGLYICCFLSAWPAPSPDSCCLPSPAWGLCPRVTFSDPSVTTPFLWSTPLPQHPPSSSWTCFSSAARLTGYHSVCFSHASIMCPAPAMQALCRCASFRSGPLLCPQYREQRSAHGGARESNRMTVGCCFG